MAVVIHAGRSPVIVSRVMGPGVVGQLMRAVRYYSLSGVLRVVQPNEQQSTDYHQWHYYRLHGCGGRFQIQTCYPY